MEEWKTRRQRLVDMLKLGPLNLKTILHEMGYPNKKALYDDLRRLEKALKEDGIKLAIKPAVCKKCGYVFRGDDEIKIPTKCPKCKSEWIDWPAIFIKEK